MTSRKKICKAVIVRSSETYSMDQVCEICGIQSELLSTMVEYGVVDPDGRRPDDWIFNARTVHLIKKAVRLHHDLAIGMPGLSLAVELLEENHSLHQTVNRLRERLRLFGMDTE